MSHITIIISHNSPVESEVKYVPKDHVGNEEIGETVAELLDGLDSLNGAVKDDD